MLKQEAKDKEKLLTQTYQLQRKQALNTFLTT
jgi:hypothetical protein